MLSAIISTSLLLASGQGGAIPLSDVTALCALTAQPPGTNPHDWQFKEALCKLPVDAKINLPALTAVRPSEAIKSLLPQSQGLAGAAGGGAGFSDAVIQGTADFLVKRGNQELELWLGERVKKLCAKPSGVLDTDVGTLFPLTCEYLKGDVLADLSDGGSSLKSAARLDLIDLPKVIVPLLEKECEKKNQKIECDALVQWRPLIEFATSVGSGVSPMAALDDLADLLCKDPGTQCPADIKNLRDVARLVRVLANETLTKDWKEGIRDGSAWLVPFAVANVLEQVPAQERAKITKWSELGPLFQGDVEATGVIRNAVSAAVQRVGGLQAALKTLKEAIDNTDDAAKRRALATAAAAILSEIDSALGAAKESDNSALRARLRAARGLVLGAVEKDFGLLVLSVTQWLETTKVLTAPEGKRILGFVAALANANDSTAVTNALDTFAAPVGSSLAKRKTKDTFFTLNAYLGGLATIDTVRNAAGTAAANEGKAFSVGGWAPIGFEFGRGGKGTGGSNSFLLHFADLGALTSYRLKASAKKATSGAGQTQAASSSPVDGAPNVTFKQVFSPGAYYIHGFKGGPFSLAIGASYSPRLRAIAAEISNERPTYVGALRFGIAFAIDIPLFP